MSNFRDRFDDSVKTRRMAYEPPKPEPKTEGKIVGWDRETGKPIAQIGGERVLLNPCSTGSMGKGATIRKRGGRYADRQGAPKPKAESKQLYIRKRGEANIMALFTIATAGGTVRWYIGGHQPKPVLVAETLEGARPDRIGPIALSNLGNGQWIVPDMSLPYARQYSSNPVENWISSLATRSLFRGGGWWFGIDDEAGVFRDILYRPVNFGTGLDAFSRWESVNRGVWLQSSYPIGSNTYDPIARETRAECSSEGIQPFIGNFRSSAIGFSGYQSGIDWSINRDTAKTAFLVLAGLNGGITIEADYTMQSRVIPDTTLIEIIGSSFGDGYGTTADGPEPEEYYPPGKIRRYKLHQPGKESIVLHPGYTEIFGLYNPPANSNLVGQNLLVVEPPNTSQLSSLNSKITTLNVRRYDLKAAPNPSIVKAKCWPLVAEGQAYQQLLGLSYHHQ